MSSNFQTIRPKNAQSTTSVESSCPPSGNSESLATQYYHQGCQLLSQTKYKEAQSYLEQAVEIYECGEASTTSTELISAYRALANVYKQQAHFESSRNVMTKWIAILEQQHEHVASLDLGKAYLELAEIFCMQEDFENVIRCCERTADIFEELGSDTKNHSIQMALLYYSLGDLTVLSGTDHARAWFEKVVRDFPHMETFNGGVMMADACARLANYYSQDDDDDEKQQAQQYYDKAWAILSQLDEVEQDDKFGLISSAYNNLGKYLQQQGKKQRARSCFEKSFQLHQDSCPRSANAAEDCLNIGWVLYEERDNNNHNNSKKAQEWFQQAQSMIVTQRATEQRPLFQTRLIMLEAMCHFGMGRILHDQGGDYEESLQQYERTLELYNVLGPRRWDAFRHVDPRPIPTRAVIEAHLQWNPFRLLSLSDEVAPAVWYSMICSKYQNDAQALYYLLREHPPC